MSTWRPLARTLIKEFQKGRFSTSELNIKIDDFADYVSSKLQVKLNDNQYAAVLSFAFSVGKRAFSKSALLKFINTEQFEKASQEFENWVLDGTRVVKALVDRRAAEFHLFNTKIEEKESCTISL